MIAKNGRDLPIEQITSDNYVVPRGEEMVYHVKIEVKQFNSKTGERVSRPRIQKFGMKTWESSVRDSLRKQGYTIEILHDPNTWIAENRARTENLKAQQQVSERAALKAEILAELKLQGFVLARPEDVKDKTEKVAETEEVKETKEVDETEKVEKKVGRPKKD